MRSVLVADLFCGAGGSSTGARQAVERLGRKMVLTCVNHWPRAIETHKRMHPEARHYCQDLATVRPLQVVPEGRLDLLMASPTCTHHSRARGGRPTSDQQRMDPEHVIAWLTQLRVKRLLIENVPEFVEWGPVDPRTGKPIKSRKGEYFRAWVGTLHALGYVVEWRILCCADYGDATTRKRFFLLARCDGKPIVWPQPSHSKDGAGAARWRGARECIDWTLRGTSIYSRPRPLAPKTIQRIYSGMIRFQWPEPYVVVLRNHMAARSIDLPLPTVAARGTHIGLAVPVRRDPAAQGQFAFIMSGHAGGAPRATSEPMPAMTAKNNGPLLIEPLISPYYGSGSGETCKGVSSPLDTITVQDRFGLVVPVCNSGGGPVARDIGSPIPTLQTSKGGHLAFITAGYGERDGQLPRTHDLEMPMPTIPARGGSTRLAQAGEEYDILFRMLHWRELARATSFSDEDQEYEFTGNTTEIVKQIGNAVPIKTARALVAASFHDLAA